MRVIAVQPDEIENWKSLLEWHFLSFCEDESLLPQDLWADIESMQRQLWVVVSDVVKAVVLTSVSQDRLKTFDITHVAGVDRQEWQHLRVSLDTVAREWGCKRFRVTCRRGWKKFMVSQGFEETHIVMEARL